MRSPAPSCPARGEDEFLREVRDRLHALAQPLTLLQVRLEAAMLCGGDAAGGQPFLSVLEGDVKRACEQFGALQGLVKDRSSAPLGRVHLSAQDLLHSVYDALSPRFDGPRLGGHGAKLQQAAPMQPIWILANEHDLRCSLLQAALLIGSILSASDVLKLSLQTAGDCALVQLAAPDCLNLNAGISPGVAEVITRSLVKLGFCVVQDSCLQATMRLPLAPALCVGASQ